MIVSLQIQTINQLGTLMEEATDNFCVSLMVTSSQAELIF